MKVSLMEPDVPLADSMTSAAVLNTPKGLAISVIARKCWDAFEHASASVPQQLAATRSSFTGLDLADQFEQFRIWCRNIGVFAKPDASLDARLRQSPSTKSTIADLLDGMTTYLDECERAKAKRVGTKIC
jgi:hypothetical protein